MNLLSWNDIVDSLRESARARERERERICEVILHTMDI